MYGLKRLNSLFTAAAVSRKRFFRSSPPVTSTRSSLLPTATARIMHKRKVLPPELSSNVLKLTCESSARGGVCDVYVIGTCHFSKESSQEVKAVVEFLKPQVVFLELCSSRTGVLRVQNLKVPTIEEMENMLKKKQNLFQIFLNWRVAKIATELGVVPGAEFCVAYEEAKKYGGKVMLGDRDTDVKKMNDVDVITRLIQEFSKHFPTVVETIVHERDQYMSATLLKVAREHTLVVAVVGKGHLPGIHKNWKQHIEVKELLSMPSETNTMTVGQIVSGIGATVAGVAIICGIYLSIKK